MPLLKNLILRQKKNCNQFLLPKDLIKYIRQFGNPLVATLPDCIGYPAANYLNWDPLPVLQLYNAYTPYLDKLCADHFDSATAPQFIIWATTADLGYGYDEIDRRNPSLEAPLTILALLRNYQLCQSYKNPNILLLERRKHKLVTTLAPFEHHLCEINQWIAVPQSSSALIGFIKLNPNAFYFLSKLYQLPEIDLQTSSSPNTYSIYRLVYPNLSSGLLLNCCPRDIPEMARLFRGDIPNPIHNINISGTGCRFFHPQFEMSWAKLTFQP